VSVTVKDDWNAQATVSWNVTILDSPWIVSVGPTSPVSALVGDTVLFMVEVQDTDTIDPPISWTWNGDLVGSGEELPMMFGARDVGEGTLRVLVSDGIGNDTGEWTVTVTEPNLPPQVTILSPGDGSSFQVDEVIPLKAEVDDDGVASLTVRWLVDGALIGTGLEVDYAALREGPISVQVSVLDGEHTQTETVNIVVKGPDDSPEGEGIADSGWFPMALALILIGVVAVVAMMALRMRRGPQD
jgi:hypothetical protein